MVEVLTPLSFGNLKDENVVIINKLIILALIQCPAQPRDESENNYVNIEQNDCDHVCSMIIQHHWKHIYNDSNVITCVLCYYSIKSFSLPASTED